MLYDVFQAQDDLLWPVRAWARLALSGLAWSGPFSPPAGPLRRRLIAALEVAGEATLTHARPPYELDEVITEGGRFAVVEEVAARTPFATLLHFRKPDAPQQPRVLIVAPMSGHFATLLRETVRTMLADHDVYITDWHNARDVPLWLGRFGLDEYVAHLIDFLGTIGPGAHALAVCQPCVAMLAATALMAEDNHVAQPRSVTLMAGPVDCRVNPTRVNELANSRPIGWFESNLIGIVPPRYPGAFRRVYPGFVQVGAFMSMNPERHRQSFIDLYRNLVEGNAEPAAVTRAFYREYFAVADLPAEFYLETVQRVFQDYSLAQGKLAWRDRVVDTRAIRRTALLTVEGEKDDICAIGQTMAAHDLCSSVRSYRKQHYMQAGAGHYGVFSGRRWQQQIYPIVRDQIHLAD
jgi:poly(3-hydroxybutyrate) depolymerase